MEKFGIDVSHWQGDFNFGVAKAEGAQYVIMKAGGGDAGLYQDKMFDAYYNKAKDAGLPVGAYFFGCAFSVDDAIKEANKFISIIRGKKFEYPLYYDVEGKMINQSVASLTAIVRAFCMQLEAAGYYAGIYSSESFFNNRMDDKQLSSFAHWVAKYSPNKPVLKSGGGYGIWQFGGTVNFLRYNHVAGVICDQDFCYTDYPKAIMEAGLNGYTKPGADASASEPVEAEPVKVDAPTANITIGSARIDENGNAQGGKAGDQKQASTPDYKGEVSLQAFYVHSKGWVVIRLKDPAQAEKLAESMIRACNNSNIGYDQARRLEILAAGTDAKTPISCDCSSLLRQCFIEATGVDPGNFTTGNERTVLKKTGLVDTFTYADGVELCTGDILVTKTKGHTVAVTDGASREESRKTNEDVAQEVVKGLWGNGAARKSKLEAAGYDAAEIQKLVNGILAQV